MSTIETQGSRVTPGPYRLGSLGPAGAIAITGNSKAAVTVVTTPLPHGLINGDKVVFAGSNSTPVIDGLRVVTRLTDTTFTVPVDTSGAGSAGNAGTFQIAITAISIDAAAAIVTCGAAHGLRDGDTVSIGGTDSTPVLDGDRVVTILSDRTFSVPVATTVVGTVGYFLKKAYTSDIFDRGERSGGGAVVLAATIGGSTHTSKVDIQGSADGINWFNIPYSLVATPRTFVITQLTVATTVTTTYLLQELIFWRFLWLAFSTSNNIAFNPTVTVVP
jgi:hypothetical protein